MVCPHCSAPLGPRDSSCDACTLKLTFGPDGRPHPVFPEVRPGEVVWARDFSRFPLPGESTRTHRWPSGNGYDAAPQGTMVTVVSKALLVFSQYALTLRDGVVRASFVAFDPYIELNVFARQQFIDSAQVRYELAVRPANLDVGLARFCTVGAGDPGAAWLHSRTRHPAVAPLGARNVLELRFFGPTLQTWVNDQLITTVHDPALATGGVGISVGTCEPPEQFTPQRVMCEWLDVRTTAA